MKHLYLAVLILCHQYHYSNAQPTTSDICLEDDYKCTISQLREVNDAQSLELLRLREEINILQRTKQVITTKDCSTLYKEGNTKSGVYHLIYKDTVNTLKDALVFCDMDTSGGGWTVFQKRFDGSVTFDRDWNNYKDGFGDINGEFWLGNELVSIMTSPPGLYRLRVDLEAFNGTKAYAEYENFNVAPESDNYRLSVGIYNGTAGDNGTGLTHQKGMMFTTRDRDNDSGGDHRNCAKWYKGGFWYSHCFNVNLNGRYTTSATSYGIIWHKWYNIPLKAASMKFRIMYFP